MEFKPIGKFKKSYVDKATNPLLNQPNVGMAAWWETGWIHEKEGKVIPK